MGSCCQPDMLLLHTDILVCGPNLLTDYIHLDSITILNLNHINCLPSEILKNTIMKMPEGQELTIKRTKGCIVRKVAKIILMACTKVVHLDFVYVTEKTIEEIWSGMGKDNLSVDSL